MYGVAQYLPDFLSSLDSQEPGPYTVECLFVDDGSPDESGRLAQAWLDGPGAAAGFTGRVIRQPNMGPSAAANTGLDAAGGEWISWPDPDDRLDPGYLAAVAELISAHRDDPPTIVDAKLVALVEETGEILDEYIYRYKYQAGERVVGLDADPTAVTGRTNNVFFPLQLVRRLGVRFDNRLRASEDELFVASVLLRAGAEAAGRVARVGLVPQARYIYRRRLARDGLADQAPRQSQFLATHVELVALPLARLGASLNGGRTPRWLTNLLVGTEKWIFENELNPATRVDWRRPVERRFRRAMRQAVALMDPADIAAFDMFAFPPLGIEFLLGLADRRRGVPLGAARMFGARLLVHPSEARRVLGKLARKWRQRLGRRTS
jgi:GT2 family glycosyltransferase